MNDQYFEMMRAGMKSSGMTEEQIDAMIEMQKAAFGAVPEMQAAAMQAVPDLQAQAQELIGDLLNGGGSYFEFAEPSSLSPAYQWAVACGADLTHLNGHIINDLPTGLEEDEAQGMLANWWGIEDKEAFLEMAESLKSGRHSVVYYKIARNLANEDSGTASNMREAIGLFAARGLLAPGDLPNMLIWDLGRLINITRFAFDAGYLDRDEALALLRAAAVEVQKNYVSWKELSIAYQFSRCVWGGVNEDDFFAMYEGMEQLLTEEDSPWVTLPFTMELDF